MKAKHFLSVLAIILMNSNCSQVDKIESPSEKLLEGLKQRYEDNNYVSPKDVPLNPYEQQGKDAGALFKKIRMVMTTNQQARKFSSIRGTGHFKLASFKSGITKVNSQETFGIESSSDLNKVMDVLVADNNALTNEHIKKTNDALAEIPLTEMGGLKILDNAVVKDGMTPLQKDLIIIHYNGISSAKSKEQVTSISNTFETEIANSSISTDEKKSLLINCAMVRYMVIENPEINAMKALNAQY